MNCRYAHPGTYGHECGKPAKWASHNPNPEGNWIGGYWHFRCDECRNHTGRDNWGLTDWVPFNPETQVNVYGKKNA